jgi:hypothetical protein
MRLLGTLITVRGDIGGQVKEDETGWQEARLTVPILGPRAEGVLNLIGGRATTGEWRFTTFEALIPSARKRVDLISGRVVELDPKDTWRSTPLPRRPRTTPGRPYRRRAGAGTFRVYLSLLQPISHRGSAIALRPFPSRR